VCYNIIRGAQLNDEVSMKLNPKSLGLAGGVLCGLWILLFTIVAVSTGYGVGYLEIMTTLFPGYTITFAGGIVGLVYGAIFGFIEFYIIGYLYNYFNKKLKK
jgi:hypothetical protein